MVELIRESKRYEVGSETAAEELIEKMKSEYNVTKYSSSYKYLKSQEREYWVVDIVIDHSL